jgi:TonB family protein
MITALMALALQANASRIATEDYQPPRLLNGRKVLTANDYPLTSLRNTEYGIISTYSEISPEGNVTGCAVTESSGYPALDKQTCALMFKRAMFEPAKDKDGNPITGYYRAAYSWMIESHKNSPKIDVALAVAQTPKGYVSPFIAYVVFDEAGHVNTCETTKSSGSVAADRAACTYISKELTVARPHSATRGVPAAAVRIVEVQFVAVPAEGSAP